MQVADRFEPEPTWLATVTTILVALIGGSVLFPRIVYDRFIWHYFWGPVYADANSAVCAVKHASGVELLGSTADCSTAAGIVAYPGYTVVSEVGYAIILLFALVGVVFLLRHLNIGRDRGLFFALIPFMFFGGALRVVEDANDAVPAGTDAAITYPLNSLIISPLIYFTVFVVTLAALLVSVWMARNEMVDTYEHVLAGIGSVGLVLTIGYLLWLSLTTAHVGFHPQIAVVVLIASTVIAGIVWLGIERFTPDLNRGTGQMGAVVLWAHTVDGVANVVGIDWGRELGLRADLVPKHPVNRALIGVGQQFPESVTSILGTAWPFLVVKLVAAVFVIAIFDDEVFRDNPRYANLLLIAIVAVGLGPGTRDALRATFGI